MTVSFLCGDLIAPENCPAPVTVTTEGDNQVITRSVDDVNGGTVTASATVRLDFTPPDVTMTAPLDGSSTANTSATISATVTDGLSGVTTATCLLSHVEVVDGAVICGVALAKGRNTLIVQSSDLAGNSASAAARVTRTGAPTAITITPSTMTLMVGAERPLTAFDDYGVPLQGALWSLSDPSVAEVVESSGVVSVRALAAGTTSITASAGGVSNTANLTVSDGVYSETGEPLGLAQGTQLWSVSADEPVAVYTNRVAEDVPDLFLVESFGAARTLRALAADGIESWREPVPYLRDGPDLWNRQPMGDSFGGIVMASNELDFGQDIAYWGVMVRLGGGTTTPWVYKAEYDFLTKTAQDPSGVISVVEWNWQRSTMTRTATSTGHHTLLEYPGWLLRVDGRTGRMLSRIPLPLTPTCSGPNYCKFWPWVWSDPVVGADGATYLLVSSGYRNLDAQSGEVVSAWHTLQLLRVQPDGTYTFRELAQGVGTAGGGPAEWPNALIANVDSRVIATRIGANSPLWLIGSESYTSTPLPPSIDQVVGLVTTPEQVLVRGSSATVSLDVSLASVNWSAQGALIAPRRVFGAIVRAGTGVTANLLGEAGTVESSGMASGAHRSGGTWETAGSSTFEARLGLFAAEPFFSLGTGTTTNQQGPRTFGTMKAAAVELLRQSFPDSFLMEREFGARLCRLRPHVYVSGATNMGIKGTNFVDLLPCPEGTNVAGEWHTHWECVPDAFQDFSPADIPRIDASPNGSEAYVGLPNLSIKKRLPHSEESTVLPERLTFPQGDPCRWRFPQ